ncbi:hypothetical protein KXV52_005596, partial [Aspergillus fumigatus]
HATTPAASHAAYLERHSGSRIRGSVACLCPKDAAVCVSAQNPAHYHDLADDQGWNPSCIPDPGAGQDAVSGSYCWPETFDGEAGCRENGM